MHFNMNCLISESRRCGLNTGICISLYATWNWLAIWICWTVGFMLNFLDIAFDQHKKHQKFSKIRKTLTDIIFMYKFHNSHCLLITVCLDQRCLELHCIWDMDHREPQSVPHWSDDLRHSLLGLYVIMQKKVWVQCEVQLIK